MNKQLLYFLVIFGFCSCVSSSYRKDFCIAEEIAARNSTQLQKQGLVPWAVGGSFRGTIRLIDRGYRTQKFRFDSIEQARFFIVKITEKFLQPFNENKEIRMYLHNFPFTAENLLFSVTFTDANQQPLLPPYIAKVLNPGGKLIYYQWDTTTNWYKEIYSEPYAKALTIYQEAQEEKK